MELARVRREAFLTKTVKLFSALHFIYLTVGRGANRKDEARGGPRVDEAEERMPE